MNRDAEALAEFRETIRIGQNLAARTPPVVFAKSPSQRAYLSAGEVQRRGGDLASACQSFKQSMRLYGEMSKPGKAETETQAKAVAAAASCR
jgi:hypothetical protein